VSSVEGYVAQRPEPLTAAGEKARAELSHQLAQEEVQFLRSELMHRDEHGHRDVDSVDATMLAVFLNLDGLDFDPGFYSLVNMSELRAICRENGVPFDPQDAKTTLNPMTEEHLCAARALTMEYDLDRDERSECGHTLRRLGFVIPDGPFILADCFLPIILEGYSASWISRRDLQSENTESSETCSQDESDGFHSLLEQVLKRHVDDHQQYQGEEALPASSLVGKTPAPAPSAPSPQNKPDTAEAQSDNLGGSSSEGGGAQDLFIRGGDLGSDPALTQSA
jgi:hypothetical protein